MADVIGRASRKLRRAPIGEPCAGGASAVSVGLRLLEHRSAAHPHRSCRRHQPAHAQFPEARQPRQHPRPDGGHRDRRDRPASRHPDARHRSLGRRQPGARDRHRRARLPRRRFRAAGHAGDASHRHGGRRRQRHRLCVRTAAASLHHHARDAQHLPRSRARTRDRPHHDARHARRHHCDRRRDRPSGSRTPSSSSSRSPALVLADDQGHGLGALDLCRRRRAGSGRRDGHPGQGRADLDLRHLRPLRRDRRHRACRPHRRRARRSTATCSSSTRSPR